MAHPLDITPPKVCFALALVWHMAWAATVPAPADWDPSYYLAVARHIAAGEGAVTEAVWNLGWLPPALRHPADLHWMPLPSRVLVPFVWLAADDWPAAQLCAVLVAAAWAPLAWAWAARLGATGATQWCAAFLAGLGGGYVRTVTTPDSIGLYGLIGGAALLAASRGSGPAALPLVMAASMTRGDGFLLGIAACLAWPGLRGWRLAVGAVGITAAWYLRCWLIAGEGWLALRARTANSLSLQDLLSPAAPAPVGVAERIAFLASELGTIATVGLLVTGGLLLWPAAVELFKRRADRGLWPIPAYLIGFPAVIHLLAPAIAAEGSVYRSGAAVFVPVCALASVGAANLTRRYHPRFLPLLLTVGSLVATTLTGQQYKRVLTQLGADCVALAEVPPGAPVLSYDPVGVNARCGNPGAVMVRGADLGPLVEAYDFRWALVAPADYDNGTVRAEDWTLPGWTRVSDRVWHRLP